ncbi:alpha/beta hydrolase family protein [Desulfosoma caldarium]|uniref:Putative redox protein n=1 Tax=Desulfosoma caldarium TaxID=610254 RepID=A0A3N1VPC1_9BACT|nr:alpha/beta fold hydrolase [Desulfosoma caldarium]ROR01767.1 putative redox protein [Desulfosoma caldarium]
MQEPEATTISIPSTRGAIPAVVHCPCESLASTDESAGVVLCCHGLLSAKNSPKFLDMAEALALRGLWAVRFDFTGCGENTSRFGASLVETRLDDLECVVAWARSRHRPWGRKAVMGLFGSSLGGFMSYVYSALFPGKVQALALWAAPARLQGIGGHAKPRPVELERTWPLALPLGTPSAVDDLPAVPDVLIVHGTHDELVPWNHAVDYYRCAAEEKRFMLLEGADHRLTDSEARAMASKATVTWFFSKLMTPAESAEKP